MLSKMVLRSGAVLDIPNTMFRAFGVGLLEKFGGAG
jgi:hypothetical protein